MKPDKCTSLTCQGPCEGCTTSHAVYEGGGWDRMGRYWMWEFKPYLGPIFLTAKGEPRVHQPGEKSPAWDVFEKWQKEKVDQPDPQPSALEVARNKIIRIQKHPQCTHAEYEAELTAILTEFKEAGR